MKIKSSALVMITCAFFAVEQSVVAQENVKTAAPMSEKDVQQLQIKTQTLINVLVQKGIIDAETARQMNAKAEQESARRYGDVTDVVPNSQKDKPLAIDPNVVRVPYVSKSVRDQIRNEVQADVEKNVIESVMKKAETERWGVPNSWPSWLQKIKLSGDVRFRAESDRFGEDNSDQYYDFIAINKAGGIIPAGQSAFINSTEDTARLRLRARLGVNVDVATGWDLGLRLASGSGTTPVSTNVTLGSNMNNSPFNLDRAYIGYKSPEKDLQVWLGRFANPWIATDLVWDEDISFGGAAVRYVPYKSDSDSDNTFASYLTLGAFPLDDIEQSAHDKWLFGVQTGLNYEWENQNSLKLALGYYDYQNIEGQFNTFASNKLDFTAPKFVQKGNAMFDIRNDDDNRTHLAALASDYNELNITMIYDIANFSPTHIVLIADFVRNIGFDARENLAALEASSNLDFSSNTVKEYIDGHKIEVLVGWPRISKLRDWNLSVAYKMLEGDAVLDAFTDSDFHTGGTDAAGYIVKGQYGLADNVAIGLQVLSSNEINGAPLAVDSWKFDVLMKF